MTRLDENQFRSALRKKVFDVLVTFCLALVVLGALTLGGYALAGRFSATQLWNRTLFVVSLGAHFWGAVYFGAFASVGVVVSEIQFEVYPRGPKRPSRWASFVLFICFALLCELCAEAMAWTFAASREQGITEQILVRALILPRFLLLLATIRAFVLAAFFAVDSK